MTEEAYIRDVLAGDRDAFARLIEPHLDLWLHIARAWTGDQQDAEDAVQEALLQCYRNLGQFRGASQFSTWATKIVIRQCYRISAKQRPVEALDQVQASAPGFEGLVALDRTIRDTLDPGEYRLFRQAIGEGRSWQEIARLTGETPGALKTRWWRIRQRLKQVLEEGS